MKNPTRNLSPSNHQKEGDSELRRPKYPRKAMAHTSILRRPYLSPREPQKEDDSTMPEVHVF